ncbi:helix-turn-helix domain-containing protein [bacterium]|nr:helix-turn-helix domain-containing protein [bacterium]
MASARGHSAAAIADIIGCTPQAVYKAIWTFQAEGLSSLTKKSNGPEHPRRA